LTCKANVRTPLLISPSNVQAPGREVALIFWHGFGSVPTGGLTLSGTG
jgi:hypothetical protein